MLRRAGWGVADQALSSLTNFLVGIVIARASTPDALGAFALAFSAYAFALNVGRALGSHPLIVQFSGPVDPTRRRAAAQALGTAAWVGIVVGLASLGIAAVFDGPIREAFLALALTIVGLMVQDGWRYVFFASGAGSKAFAVDAIWAALLIPALLATTSSNGIFWPMVVWGASAAVAAAAGAIIARLVPTLRIRDWWRQQRDLGSRYLGEAITSVLSGQAVLYGLGIVSGLAAVGALRAGQLVLGPINIAIQGIQLVAVPDAIAVARSGTSRLLRFVLLVGAAIALSGAAWGAIVLLMPTSVGEAFLGESWLVAQPVLLPLIVGNVFLGPVIAGYIGLRALAAAGRSLRATNIGGVLTVGIGLAGAWVGGAPGAAWGMAVATGLGCVIWLVELQQALVEQRTGARNAAPIP